MDKTYAGIGLSAQSAIGTRPAEETATAAIEQTLKLAGELAYRANRLEARLFGERAEACASGVPGPDGVVNQLVAMARSTDDALNDAIRSLNRIAQQMGAE